MIESASCREGRSDLGHSECDEQTEDDAQRPYNARRSAADSTDSELKRGDTARQDADGGEGNGKVGEAIHAPLQILGIPHGGELFYIV